MSKPTFANYFKVLADSLENAKTVSSASQKCSNLSRTLPLESTRSIYRKLSPLSNFRDLIPILAKILSLINRRVMKRCRSHKSQTLIANKRVLGYQRVGQVESRFNWWNRKANWWKSHTISVESTTNAPYSSQDLALSTTIWHQKIWTNVLTLFCKKDRKQHSNSMRQRWRPPRKPKKQ